MTSIAAEWGGARARTARSLRMRNRGGFRVYNGICRNANGKRKNSENGIYEYNLAAWRVLQMLTPCGPLAFVGLHVDSD